MTAYQTTDTVEFDEAAGFEADWDDFEEVNFDEYELEDEEELIKPKRNDMTKPKNTKLPCCDCQRPAVIKKASGYVCALCLE